LWFSRYHKKREKWRKQSYGATSRWRHS